MQVVWLSVDPDIPAWGYWDQTLLAELLKECPVIPTISGRLLFYEKEAIVIIPGAYMGKHIDRINEELAHLDKCKVIITSDEENNFPIDELRHNNMEIYANYTTGKYSSDITWLPIGAARMPKVEYRPKTLDWFFAGQVNHESRRKLIDVLKPLHNGDLVATDGFAQGLEHEEYYQRMSTAKAVPAPRGNISPDSFRFYEALEVGAVPIPENEEFWHKLFPDFPMDICNDWTELPRLMNKPVVDQNYRNQCVAWWQRKKLDIKDGLIGKPDTTVVIPVSPIASHPSTEIIDETIKSVQLQLPEARIIVTFDGVRKEQAGKTQDYHEFIERFLRKYNGDVYPIIFDEHTHQVGMLRNIIPNCSEYIVYVEQDTPFTDDYIDWNGCKQALKRVNLVRFHFEAFIPEPHQYLMMGAVRASAVPLIRTKQWSQRPHLTTRDFYQKVLGNFSEGANSFIEDKMHSIAQQYPREYRLGIYNPGGSIKRSYHTDGRAGGEKWDDTQIF